MEKHRYQNRSANVNVAAGERQGNRMYPKEMVRQIVVIEPVHPVAGLVARKKKPFQGWKGFVEN